jgi:hypothetical protein
MNGREETGGGVPPKRLGAILLEKGYIKESQLQQALDAQAKRGDSRLIGQIMVSRGFVRAPHVQVALAVQKQMRSE